MGYLSGQNEGALPELAKKEGSADENPQDHEAISDVGRIYSHDPRTLAGVAQVGPVSAAGAYETDACPATEWDWAEGLGPCLGGTGGLA